MVDVYLLGSLGMEVYNVSIFLSTAQFWEFVRRPVFKNKK
jgi:hypothetical protein